MKKKVLFFLAIFTLYGCETNQTKLSIGPAGLQKVVAYSADEVIIPSIKSWQQSATKFNILTRQFCRLPDGAKLKRLQLQYQDLSLQWSKALVFDFGPQRDNLFSAKINFIESMRQRGKDYSNTVRTRLQQRLRDKTKLDSAFFAGLNFNLVGMSALELMIFTDFTSRKTTSRSIVNNYRKNPRSCELLIGMSALNADTADYVVDGWLKKFRGQNKPYRDLFVENKLINGEQSLTKLVFSLQDYFRYIKQRKLDGKLDASLSGMTYINMIEGLDTVKNLFTVNNGKFSLQKYLQASGKSKTASKFLAIIEKAKVQARQKNRKNMSVSYAKLIKVLEKDIPNGLGINFGINFTDGD